MSDEEQVPTTAETEQETETVQPVSKEEYEAIKKAQRGSDKKVKELQSMVQDLTNRLKQEESKEKTAEEQLEELRRDLKAKEVKEMRFGKLTDAGLPEVSKLFDYDTQSEDGLDQWVTGMKELIEKKAHELTDKTIKERFSNDEKPKTGEGVKNKYSKDDIRNMSPEEFATLDVNKITIEE